MKILVLESSTSSAKALIYDAVKKSSYVMTKQYPRMHDDMTVHSAQTVYEKMLEVAKELLNGDSDIDMISLSSTWHSLCLFDKQMEPQTSVFPWCYTGASDICKEIRQDKEYVHTYYQKTGCMVNAIYPFFKLKMLKAEGQDLTQFLIGGQGVYNTYKLTGRRVATECIASGTGMLNIRTKKYEPALIEELGITEDLLPEVITYEKTFPLLGEAAEYLGIREGIPVIPSNSDGGLNQIGVGALKKGVMTFSVGTSGAMRLTTDTPIIPEQPSLWCYLSPKSWLSGAATSGACNCIDWFKSELAGSASYTNLETECEDTENFPTFLPFTFGERCPGWNDDRRGGFENMDSSHSVQELYKSVQEGVLFNLFQCYELLTSINGVPERIKLSGGILNSPLWTQMCADIFEEKLEVDQEAQSSLMGGAVLAMELLGIIDSVEAYSVEPVRIIKPNPKQSAVYRKRYEQYKKYYNAYENK